jgi:hypothetical protein
MMADKGIVCCPHVLSKTISDELGCLFRRLKSASTGSADALTYFNQIRLFQTRQF